MNRTANMLKPMAARITAEQTNALATIVQRCGPQSAEGRAARNRLVEAHGGLVVKLASFYSNAWHESFEDCVQDGYLGLMRAAETFDPTLGTAFSTHALWWIRQAIQHSLRERGRLIHIPAYVQEAMLRIRRGVAHPDDERIASSAEMMAHAPLWFSTKIAHTGASHRDLLLGDMIADEVADSSDDESAEHIDADIQARAILATARQTLTPREYRVFVARVLDDLPLETLAQELGRSRERVRQIEIVALRKVRVALGVTDAPNATVANQPEKGKANTRASRSKNIGSMQRIQRKVAVV